MTEENSVKSMQERVKREVARRAEQLDRIDRARRMVTGKERDEDRRSLALTLAVKTLAYEQGIVNMSEVKHTANQMLWLANEYRAFIENGIEPNGLPE